MKTRFVLPLLWAVDARTGGAKEKAAAINVQKHTNPPALLTIALPSGRPNDATSSLFHTVDLRNLCVLPSKQIAQPHSSQLMQRHISAAPPYHPARCRDRSPSPSAAKHPLFAAYWNVIRNRRVHTKLIDDPEEESIPERQLNRQYTQGPDDEDSGASRYTDEESEE
ncbi:hypothetical protein EDB80DRAFT_677398 [Ilyonectria destructans]|nr:hypothetical protein EDB80DRAFT_677398 [Ilyonectria destructans]